MLIIGCDFHTRCQQVATARKETAELVMERRLDHESGEAHAFYRSLQDARRVAKRTGEFAPNKPRSTKVQWGAASS